MAKKKTVRKQEQDSVYLLKLVVYLIVGSQWLRLVHADGTTALPIPIGLAVGLVLAMHDHFRTDRKIEYAVLLIATLVGFYTSMGIYLTV